MRLLPGVIHPAEAGLAAEPAFPLFCLAPRGVCPASFLAVGAVSSYLAFSPWPCVAKAPQGGMFSVTLSVAPAYAKDPRVFTRHVALRCPDFPLVRSRPKPARRATTPADP